MAGSVTSPPRLTAEQAAARAANPPNFHPVPTTIAAVGPGTVQTATVGRGVGTELTKLITEYGLSETGVCGCAALAAELDGYGVEESERRKNKIIAHLRTNAKDVSWVKKVEVGFCAWWSGRPMTLPGLVDEAILRARAAVTSPLQT